MEISLRACIYPPGLVTQLKLHYVAALEGKQGAKKAKFCSFSATCSWFSPLGSFSVICLSDSGK